MVEEGSSGQGWEGLRIIHVGDRHSSRLRETEGGKLRGTCTHWCQERVFKNLNGLPVYTDPLNSRRYLGIMRTIFKMSFLLKGRLLLGGKFSHYLLTTMLMEGAAAAISLTWIPPAMNRH